MPLLYDVDVIDEDTIVEDIISSFAESDLVICAQERRVHRSYERANFIIILQMCAI